jgi:hypothetical protein
MVIDNIMNFKNVDLKNKYELIKDDVEFNRNRGTQIIRKDEYIPIELTDLYLNYGNYFLNLFKYFNEEYNSSFQINQNFNLIKEIFKNKNPNKEIFKNKNPNKEIFKNKKII